MQSPSFRLINAQNHCSFVIKEEPFDLNTRWHYHEELEIMYFHKGKVSAIMGNRFCEFEAGDLILLGSNFPHVVFESKKKSDRLVQPEGVVIQFRENFLGDSFFSAPEFKAIRAMLAKSKGGIKFPAKALKPAKDLIQGISKRKRVRQLLDLLEVLNLLSEEKKIETLSLESPYGQSQVDERRMAVIKEYLNENFRGEVSITEVASLVNMTVTSFCRYYKGRTLKHFKQTLNEMRISYACDLLGKDKTVQEACYESGFNNPAYFSRTFKKIVGVNPSSYKNSTGLSVVRW